MSPKYSFKKYSVIYQNSCFPTKKKVFLLLIKNFHLSKREPHIWIQHNKTYNFQRNFYGKIERFWDTRWKHFFFKVVISIARRVVVLTHLGQRVLANGHDIIDIYLFCLLPLEFKSEETRKAASNLRPGYTQRRAKSCCATMPLAPPRCATQRQSAPTSHAQCVH